MTRSTTSHVSEATFRLEVQPLLKKCIIDEVRVQTRVRSAASTTAYSATAMSGSTTDCSRTLAEPQHAAPQSRPAVPQLAAPRLHCTLSVLIGLGIGMLEWCTHVGVPAYAKLDKVESSFRLQL